MITFDPTISLGAIMTFAGFVVGGLGVVYTLRSDVKFISDRLGSVELELQKMSDVLVQLGRQDERLNSFNRRMESIEERIHR